MHGVLVTTVNSFCQTLMFARPTVRTGPWKAGVGLPDKIYFDVVSILFFLGISSIFLSLPWIMCLD